MEDVRRVHLTRVVIIFTTITPEPAIEVLALWHTSRLNGIEDRYPLPITKRKAMVEKVVPMIHVLDVRATVDWYQSIGFTVNDTYSDDGDGLSFAMLSFGKSEVMFNEGGRTSTEDRREVDLYVYSENVDQLYDRLKDRVEVVQELYDTFYGMREFIIRDINRFWITFGQTSAFQVLMTGVREGNPEVVRGALESGSLKPDRLTIALAVASAAENVNVQIVELLEKAGAVLPPEIDAQTLQSYAGKYKSEHGSEVNVTLAAGKLFVAWFSGQTPVSLIPVNDNTFRPVAFDDVTLTFRSEAGKTVGFELKQGAETMQHKRLEESK